jgi:predicted RNA binding protein YcfA (HicA-like mRNA interferase family)
MSRDTKLIEQLLQRPRSGMRWDDVRKALEILGWELKRQKGSHAAFRKDGRQAITISLVGGQMVRREAIIDICENADEDIRAFLRSEE